MATIYVRSTDGNDADSGATWALAKATLTGAMAAAAAGDTIYVSHQHAHSVAAAITLTCPGTPGNPVRVICVNDGAEPPTTLATTATEQSTGSNNVIIKGGVSYWYGIGFTSGSAGGTRHLQICDQQAVHEFATFEQCSFKTNGATAGGRIKIGPTAGASSTAGKIVRFKDCTFAFNNVGNQMVVYQCRAYFQGGSLGGTIPTGGLIDTEGDGRSVMFFEGFDFSALGSNAVFKPGSDIWSDVYLQNCKMGTSHVWTTGTFQGPGGWRIRAVNCDSADTQYAYDEISYCGTITEETTIVRTGGSSEWGQATSAKLASSANVSLFVPLEMHVASIPNESVGSSLTATVEVITDNVTLTDAEAWIEVQYLGTSGVPKASFANDRVANSIATPANQPTSSETWTTTGLTTPVKQYLSVAFTPQEKGLVHVKVFLAKASTTMYVCNKVAIA